MDSLTLTEQQKRDIEAVLRDLSSRVHLSEAPEVVRQARRKVEDIRLSRVNDFGDSGFALAARIIAFVGMPDTKDISERKLALAALQYLVDPWETIPDMIPKYGLLDDIYALTLADAAISKIHKRAANGYSDEEAPLRLLPTGTVEHLARLCMERKTLSAEERQTLVRTGEKLSHRQPLAPDVVTRVTRILQRVRVNLVPCKQHCAYCSALESVALGVME